MPSPENPEFIQSPAFRFKPEVWKTFMELGRIHNKHPDEVAKRVVEVVEEIANIEKRGGIVLARTGDDMAIVIKIFGNHRNGNINNSL